MPRTFEEQVVGHLDALYQGALFLRAGDERAAFDLVTQSVVSAAAARDFDGEHDGLEQALESALVRTYLSRANDGAVAEVAVDSGSLFDAAALLRPRARAAIWLVHLRRWGYDASSEALGTNLTELSALLGERDQFARHLGQSWNDNASASGHR